MTSSDRNRKIEGEVTRVESTEYLQGATGHAVLSLGFLVATGVVYWFTESVAVVIGGITSIFLISANGLSIYLWDVTRRHVWVHDTSAEESPDAAESTESRTLSVSLTPSTVHKAEHVASGFQVLIMVVTIALVVQLFQRLAVETASVLLVSLLFAGNAGALVLKYLGVI